MKRGVKITRRIVAALTALLIIGVYIWRVYRVNNSPILTHMAEVVEFSEKCDVPLPSGYYNRGYLKQDGYYANVSGSILCRIDELNKLGITTREEEKAIHAATGSEWIIIVSADFHFAGDTDPLEGIIDLSDYKLVGPDYCLDCSIQLNEIGVFNKFLSGNSAFSIASGKTIHVELPFIVETNGAHGIAPDYIRTHELKLLLSRYPVETYVKLTP